MMPGSAGTDERVVDPVFIGLGSNLGDSRKLVQRAWQRLGRYQEIELVTLSAPYLSAPVGMDSNHWFVNAVGRVKACCTAERMLAILLDTEDEFGRARRPEHKGYQDRTIDLDLIYFGDLVCDDVRLTLPHPRRTDRMFVLAPLVSIAADFIDPESGLGETAVVLLERLQQRISDKQLAAQEIIASTWDAGN